MIRPIFITTWLVLSTLLCFACNSETDADNDPENLDSSSITDDSDSTDSSEDSESDTPPNDTTETDDTTETEDTATGSDSDDTDSESSTTADSDFSTLYPERTPNQSETVTWMDEYGDEAGLFLPAAPADAALPIVMFLHACNNPPVATPPWLISELNDIEPTAVFFPQRPHGGECADWGGTYDASMRTGMQRALDHLDNIIERYNFDATRQTLYGESMGAEGVFRLLMDLPERFAGAVAVVGYTKIKGADAMAKTPLWIIHGSADTINPVSSSRDIYQAILDAGGEDVTYTEYEGLDHVPALQAARNEPGVLDWLLNQQRTSD